MESQIQVLPTAKITANSISFYNSYLFNGHRKAYNKKSEENLTRGTYNGFLSKPQQKKITGIVGNLHAAINHKFLVNHIKNDAKLKPITFLTLTLPSQQKHTDQFIKRHMLNYFITKLKREGFLKSYVWKAEAQKNGNLHFHLVFAEFIPKVKISEYWNSICDQHGYLDEFKAAQKHINAPSTKIEASRSIGNTSKYLAKYISKKDDSRPIKGRIWGCSDNLRDVKDCTVLSDNSLERKMVQCEKLGILDVWFSDHCTVYSGKILSILKTDLPHILNEFVAQTKRNYDKIYDIQVPIKNTAVESAIYKRPKLPMQTYLCLN